MTRPALDISTFAEKFKTGARSYLFYLQPAFPSGLMSDAEFPVYLVRSASLPGSSFDELITSWMGTDYKAAGKRTYDTWNVSFNVDKDAAIRLAFIRWADLMMDPTTNALVMPKTYMQNQFVTLLGADQTEKIKYELIGAWPSQIAEVSLDYANSDYAQFDVTFTYQYYQTTPK